MPDLVGDKSADEMIIHRFASTYINIIFLFFLYLLKRESTEDWITYDMVGPLL